MSEQASRLRAGVAAATITPDHPTFMQGFGARTAPAIGVLDQLEARAIVLQDDRRRVAILTADLLGLDHGSVERVRAAVTAGCGLPGEDLVVLCSHTHAGPAVMEALAGTAADVGYRGRVERALADVVVAAARGARAAALGVGEGAADFNVNRRLRTTGGVAMRPSPLGAVDRRVRVLRVDHLDAPEPGGTLGGRPLPGRDPLAVLFAYTCHPTALGAENRRYSGDYPGAARRFVEQAYHPADGPDGPPLALFLPGCFGEVRPYLVGPDGRFRGATEHELRVLGRLLGSEVVRVAERIVAEPTAELALARSELRLPYAAAPTEAELRAQLGGEVPRWAERTPVGPEAAGRPPDAETAELQVLRLGRHWLVALPGEPMQEIGWAIERGLVELGLASRERGDLTLVVGYANGQVGYLCTASAVAEGGYESAIAWRAYGRPGPFAPSVESLLVDAALRLALAIGPAAEPAGP
jgi:hypothetical protein